MGLERRRIESWCGRDQEENSRRHPRQLEVMEMCNCVTRSFSSLQASCIQRWHNASNLFRIHKDNLLYDVDISSPFNCETIARHHDTLIANTHRLACAIALYHNNLPIQPIRESPKDHWHKRLAVPVLNIPFAKGRPDVAVCVRSGYLPTRLPLAFIPPIR